jgi:hypothetical protein
VILAFLQEVVVVVHGMVHKRDMDLDHRVQVDKAVVVAVVHLRVPLVQLVLNTRVVVVVVGRLKKVLRLRTVVMVVPV